MVVIQDTFSVNGCDSMVTLNLMVLPESMSLTHDTICEGMTYDFNAVLTTTQEFLLPP
ncbi:MAG: hypothetical protein R2769_16480 [Saprospiraceae bacterium]